MASGWVTPPGSRAVWAPAPVGRLEECVAEAAQQKAAAAAAQKELADLKGDIICDFAELFERCCIRGEAEALGVRADVSISSRNEDDTPHRIRAHSLVLKARCEVFRTMLCIKMREAESGDIDATNFRKGTVLALLRFLYTSEIQKGSTPIELVDLIRAAQYYQLPRLLGACVERLALCEVLSVGEALEVFGAVHEISAGSEPPASPSGQNGSPTSSSSPSSQMRRVAVKALRARRREVKGCPAFHAMVAAGAVDVVKDLFGVLVE